MSRQIRVEESVYERLAELRGRDETFSDVIGRLVGSRETICNLINVLEGVIRYREWQHARQDREETAH